MNTLRCKLAALLAALLCAGAVMASDAGPVAYIQSAAFNAPILAGWEDQSGDGFAQFMLAEAQATIRTTIMNESDPVAAAAADLAKLVGGALPDPLYRGKVNLADGTWQSLVYDVDAATTASAMARRAGGGTVVISFVERDPAARILLLTIAQADDAQADAGPELALALETLALPSLDSLAEAETRTLPSGSWLVYEGESLQAMGMVFGNDSYVALQQGEGGDLATIADAYNRALLGFFVTPDNSLYLALGLAATAAILGLLLFSFVWRARSLNKDLALLAELARSED